MGLDALEGNFGTGFGWDWTWAEWQSKDDKDVRGNESDSYSRKAS